MPLDRTPTSLLTHEELAEVRTMLPPDGVCRICGRWECLDCGVIRSYRNRFFENPQRCPTCKSPNGQMLPSRHRDEIEHFLSFIRVSVDGDQVRYPVGTPIPEPALQFIARLRG